MIVVSVKTAHIKENTIFDWIYLHRLERSCLFNFSNTLPKENKHTLALKIHIVISIQSLAAMRPLFNVCNVFSLIWWKLINQPSRLHFNVNVLEFSHVKKVKQYLICVKLSTFSILGMHFITAIVEFIKTIYYLFIICISKCSWICGAIHKIKVSKSYLLHFYQYIWNNSYSYG